MLGTFSLQRNGKIPFLYYIMQIQDTIIRLIWFSGICRERGRILGSGYLPRKFPKSRLIENGLYARL
jgi:hypothetical protein